MPKVGIIGKDLVIYDTRPYALQEPIKIPIEQVQELIKQNKRNKK